MYRRETGNPSTLCPRKPFDQAAEEAEATCGRGGLEVLLARDSAAKQTEDLTPEEEVKSLSSVFSLIQGKF